MLMPRKGSGGSVWVRVLTLSPSLVLTFVSSFVVYSVCVLSLVTPTFFSLVSSLVLLLSFVALVSLRTFPFL